MCDVGINPDCFNPRIFYMLKRKFNEKCNMEYHSHDFASFIFILSGSCSYKIDNILYHVKKGDLVVCNPGVFHGKILSGDDEITEFHVGFNNIHLKNLAKDYLIPENTVPVINLLKYEQEFFKCSSEILLEQEKSEPGSDLVLKSLGMKLIAIFLKATYIKHNNVENPGFKFESYDRTSIVNTLITFINENYMKDISLNKISKNMYLSPVYISKVFKDEMGESPINYLIKTRLSKAAEMLTDSHLSVKTIAKNVGYQDAYHFSKLFKKYYGKSPLKYKASEQI